VNALGTHHLLEAINRHVPEARVHIAASSDEYGKVDPGQCPIDESAPLRPVSPYAVSRVTGEWIGRMFHESFGLHVVVTRGFMHTGPGQPPSFATADWARQIARAEAGKDEPVVRVGNLAIKREFGDVRDVVRAYRSVLEQGEAGEAYNVATGDPHELREVLELLIELSTIDIRVEVDESKLRPIDFPVLYGDSGKLERLTGWKPAYRLEDTLSDVLDYWRQQIA
jgi:GDP-4-dehydro-6-deoxy-D-mannose reductase